MTRDRFVNPYKSEEELCSGFAEYARSAGWRVYPETSNWDLLLVATPEVKTKNVRSGDQLGIQAKLNANIEVLRQAMPQPDARRGPNFHGVLVPRVTPDFREVAHGLFITPIAGTRNVYTDRPKTVQGFKHQLLFLNPLFRLEYSEPLWCPEVEVWTPAGVPSPASLTPWKFKAVRLCIEGRAKGFLTSSDFYAQRMGKTLWIRNGWVVELGEQEKYGKQKKYVLTDKAPDHIYPEITKALLERGTE